MKNWTRIIAIVLAVLLALGTLSSFVLAEEEDAPAQTVVVVTSPFTAAIAQVRGSVVGVSNYQMRRQTPYGSSWYGFGYGYGYGYGYGGNQPEEQEVLTSTGSGVVIAEHYVLTNYHVIENAATVRVTVSHDDGTEADVYQAVVVAGDEQLDAAILYAPELELPAVTLGDSDTLQIGDWAICIGNPLGEVFSGTVTAGIVSGLNRNIASSATVTDRYGRRTQSTNTMIQIDTAINSGNSGGGMFAVTGELMGIPTLKYSSARQSGAAVDGIGMCIPINSAKPMIEQVLSVGLTAPMSAAAGNAGTTAAAEGVDMTGRPRMGVTMTQLSANNSSLSYGVRYGVYYGRLPGGVYVVSVEDGSPAARAGIQPGDIIVDVNDHVITTSQQIQQIVSQFGTGDTMRVKVYRVPGITTLGDNTNIPDGEYIDLQVVLAIVDNHA